MTDQYIRLLETQIEGKRLGRHVRHDARSANYRVQRTASSIVSRFYPGTNRFALDQDGVGACVGFGLGQNLNAMGMTLTTQQCFDLYSLATTKDPFPGQWPPDDTGSSGLGGCLAARELGYIESWTNAYDIDDVLHALQEGPGTLGCTWYQGCDEPSIVGGLVTPVGAVRGGHQTAIVGVDAVRCTIILRNSWGDWGYTIDGQTGYFCLGFVEFAALLNETGDAIFPKLKRS